LTKELEATRAAHTSELRTCTEQITKWTEAHDEITKTHETTTKRFDALEIELRLERGERSLLETKPLHEIKTCAGCTPYTNQRG